MPIEFFCTNCYISHFSPIEVLSAFCSYIFIYLYYNVCAIYLFCAVHTDSCQPRPLDNQCMHYYLFGNIWNIGVYISDFSTGKITASWS